MLVALQEVREGHLVEAAWTVGDVGQIVGQQPDDLAEAERDDRQVVAAQSQRRGAEDQAAQRSHRHGQRHTGQPRPRRAEEPGGPQLVPRTLRAGQQRHGVGADGVEAHVTEVEQTRLPDDDVEADRDDRDHRELSHGAAETDSRCVDESRCEQRGQRDPGEQDDPEHPFLSAGQTVPPVHHAGPDRARLLDSAHARAFPRLSPSIPVGRTSSTSTSSTNATTSRHCVPNTACP